MSTEAAHTTAAPVTFREAYRREPALRAEALRRRSRAEKCRLVAEICLACMRVRRVMPRDPLPAVLARARQGAPADPRFAAADAEGHLAALRLGYAVQRTLHLLPGDTRCLTRSLVLTTLLARRGIGSTLIISVSPGADFAAHAWIEHGGEPVLPADDPGFGRLLEL